MPAEKAVYFSHIDSPVGRLLIAATDDGLRYIYFEGSEPKHKKGEVWIESAAKVRGAGFEIIPQEKPHVIARGLEVHDQFGPQTFAHQPVLFIFEAF